MNIHSPDPSAPPSAEIAKVGGAKKRRSFIRQVLRDRPSALFGAVLVGAIALCGIFAPFVAPYAPTEVFATGTEPPSPLHILGLDGGGHDVLSQLIFGIRVSLFVGLAAGLASMVIGGTAGIIAGYYGGRVDSIVGRTAEFFLVMPELVLMALFAALLGPSLLTITGVITLLLWTGTCLIVRAQVKSVRERVYVKRARSIGASNRRIMIRHVLPQVVPLLIANTILIIAVAIFEETFLAFLGLGDPSTVSLGRMIEFAFNDSAASRGAWWTLVPPGVVVTLIILGLTMMGQALEDALNPRLKVSYLSVRSFLVRTPIDERKEAS